MRKLLPILIVTGAILSLVPTAHCARPGDPIAELQETNTKTNETNGLHWGPNPKTYSNWTTHSNRLIPVYTFGINLDPVNGENSIYRSEEKLKALFGFVPTKTVNPEAEYFDQTDVYRLQKMAVQSGKRRIILFVYDGMDWQTTWAAAINKTGQVPYREGRGTGLHFQDYRGANTDFGYFVTTPHNNGTDVNVDRQIVTSPGGDTPGGYDPNEAGDKHGPFQPIPVIRLPRERIPSTRIPILPLPPPR